MKRYEIVLYFDPPNAQMEESKYGEWVRFEDILEELENFKEIAKGNWYFAAKYEKQYNQELIARSEYRLIQKIINFICNNSS